MQKISYLGCGMPILNSKHGVMLPVDKRLSREQAIKANRRDEVLFIAFQERLLQAKLREENILKEVTYNDV